MRKKLSAILVIVVMLTLASSANALVSKQLGYKRVTSSSSAPVNFALSSYIVYLPCYENGTPSGMKITSMRNTVTNYANVPLSKPFFQAVSQPHQDQTDVYGPAGFYLDPIYPGASGYTTEVDWEEFTDLLGHDNFYPYNPYVFTANGVIAQSYYDVDAYYFFYTYWYPDKPEVTSFEGA